jgi:RNA polymerase sigma-70 factor (ECF subfamily)
MIIPKEICDGLSDLEIIRKSLEEVDYFSCLYERYEARMLRYIRHLTSLPGEEVEDVLQEAFIKVWINLNAFDQSLKLSTWLYRIVHNHTISYMRKKKSYGKDRKVRWNEALFAKMPDEAAAEWEEKTPDEDQLIRGLLDQLPLPYRQVLTLKFLEDMSYAEISDVLQIPEGTVATRINRAKKAFAKLSASRHITFDR